MLAVFLVTDDLLEIIYMIRTVKMCDMQIVLEVSGVRILNSLFQLAVSCPIRITESPSV